MIVYRQYSKKKMFLIVEVDEVFQVVIVGGEVDQVFKHFFEGTWWEECRVAKEVGVLIRHTVIL